MESIVGELGFMATSAGKAFVTLMEPHRLMFLGLGCIMGLVLGIIPGIGGLTGTAMLLPFTFNMDPYSAFALLLGLGATPQPATPFQRSCSACPEVPPPQQRCSMATPWRSGARPAAPSAPPTCHP